MVQSINQAIVFKHNFGLLIFVSLLAEGHISDMLKFFGGFILMEDVQVQSINQATADEQSFGLLNFVSLFKERHIRDTSSIVRDHSAASCKGIIKKSGHSCQAQLWFAAFCVIMFALFVARHTSNSFKGFLNHFDAKVQSINHATVVKRNFALVLFVSLFLSFIVGHSSDSFKGFR